MATRGSRATILAECYECFSNQDYDGCIQELVELGLASGFRIWSAILLMSPEVLQVRQMFLISQQRLGQHRQAERDAAMFFLSDTREKNWHVEILRLTTGDATVQEVLDLAADDEQRFQTLFYGAERMITEKRMTDALRLLDESSGYSVRVPEVPIANVRRTWLQRRVPNVI